MRRIIRRPNASTVLRLIHGIGPWWCIAHSRDQRAILTNEPADYGLAFLHRARGFHEVSAFTGLTIEVRDRPGELSPRPSIEIRHPARWSFIWLLQEPSRPTNEFFQAQENLCRAFGGRHDYSGLSRLIPLPGNEEFPAAYEIFPWKYRLEAFAQKEAPATGKSRGPSHQGGSRVMQSQPTPAGR